MPSHVHLIVQTNTSHLGSTIRDLKKYTAVHIAQHLNNENIHDAHLLIFQNKVNETKRNKKVNIWFACYYIELIFRNKFLFQKLYYIQNNPIQTGLAIKPEDY